MNTTEISTAAGEPVLSVSERAELLECEELIQEGRSSFFKMGHALRRICDQRLYRGKYQTFEDYCLAEWDMTARFARYLRNAAQVCSHLIEKNFDPLPATESQARPIAGLPEAEWGPAWEEVLGTAKDGMVTASHVAAVAQRRLERLTPASEKPQAAPSEVLKPLSGGEPIDVPDISTREKRIRAVAREAQLRLRELAEMLATADSVIAGEVVVMVNGLDDLQDHLSHKEKMLASRDQERVGL